MVSESWGKFHFWVNEKLFYKIKLQWLILFVRNKVAIMSKDKIANFFKWIELAIVINEVTIMSKRNQKIAEIYFKHWIVICENQSRIYEQNKSEKNSIFLTFNCQFWEIKS